MILALDALAITIPIVVVLQVIVALLLILIVMMQKPKEQGLGAAFGGATAGEVFGARTTDVLQKGTIYLGVLFFALTLLLAVLTSARNKQAALLNPQAEVAEETIEPEAPAAGEEAAEPAADGESAEPAADGETAGEVEDGGDDDSGSAADAADETPADDPAGEAGETAEGTNADQEADATQEAERADGENRP